MRSKKFTICALLIMIFIFLQSALPADLSSTESGVIVGWIMEHFGAALYLSEGAVIFAVRAAFCRQSGSGDPKAPDR